MVSTIKIMYGDDVYSRNYGTPIVSSDQKTVRTSEETTYNYPILKTHDAFIAEQEALNVLPQDVLPQDVIVDEGGYFVPDQQSQASFIPGGATTVVAVVGAIVLLSLAFAGND